MIKRMIKRVLAGALRGPLFQVIPSVKVVESADEAAQIVAKHSPDLGESALCNHVWPEPEMDLSIIVPVYNVERYLKRCLTSILNQQTEYSFHVVVVNDGATDKSEVILDSYCNCNRISVIHQENGGISKARNAGLKEVKGRYIMFVDSDDFLPDNTVDSLMRAACEMDADIVQGSYYDMDEEGNAFQGGKHYKKCVGVMPNGMLAGMAWGKIYKADLFRGVHFPEGYWYEDTIVTGIITHLAKRIATIPNIVYYYRRNSAGITKKSIGKPKSVDTYWVHKSVMQDRKKLGLVTDCAFYEHLLRMMALSYQRTEKEPDEVKKSLFVLWRKLLAQERRSEFEVNPKYRNLETAVMEGSYNKYSVLCKFCY